MFKTTLTLVMAALCLIFSGKAQSPEQSKPLQKQTITGKVISAATGEALPGAVIKNTTTNQTVITNNDGDFTLQLPNGNYSLAIYYLSYKAKNITIQIPLKEKLIISLDTDEQNLKEVEINAGYYTVKDKERTGSISRVTAETISKQPVSNPLAALIGRMAGVNIEQQSGINGGSFKVEIRGVNSLRPEGREPLYLVDGVPYPSLSLTDPYLSVSGISGLGSPLNYISPSDISSIEVLKDADATAIYGSRGANGVILIKTKTAKAGKTTLDVNVSGGISKVSSKPELLNTQQYLEMRNEAFKNDATTPQATDYDLNGTWDQNKYTDWQKVLIGGTAQNTNIQTAINGGNESTQFSLRGNYSKQTTVIPGNFANQNGSGALTVNHTSFNKKFKASLSANYAINNNKLPNFDLTQYITLAPNAPDLYDDKGNLNWALDSDGAATWENPLSSIKKPYNSTTHTFIASGLLHYELIPGLFLRSSLGYTNVRLQEDLLTPISSQAPSAYTLGYHQMNFNSIQTWIIEPQLNYKKTWDTNTLDLLLGSTFQQEGQQAEGISGIGYTSDLLLESISAAPSKYASSSSAQYRYNALFGRINYNYQGKYLINLTGRRDGSSRFGPGRQLANFGALGAAWIFTEEKLVTNNLPYLSFGKLRASYGLTGSDQIPNYGYLETYAATEPYLEVSGLFPTGLANPDYSWETNKKLEAALDLGFLKNKLFLSVSWYRNRSSNQLVGYTLPDITGFPSIQYNLPATVQNTGWEFEINSSNIATFAFKWTSAFNLTVPQNKLLSYPNLEGSGYSNTYTVGASLYTPKSYHFLGVNPETGVYNFQDQNGNGSIDAADRITAKQSLSSHFYGGLQNSFSFKSFTLDIFFQFVSKTVLSPFTSAQFGLPGTMGNQPVQVLQRWQNPGDLKDFQRYTQSYVNGGAGTGFSNLYNADRFADASFIRLKNVSFSWNAPPSWLQKIKLNTLRIYIQGQNLFTITKYIGDPEVANLKTLPSLTTVSAGIQLSL